MLPLSALRTIAQSLSTTVSLDSTLDLIVRTTTEVMGVDSCTLYLLEEDGQTLRLRATTGLRHVLLGVATLQVGEGMTGAAVAQNRPILAANAPSHPLFKLVDVGWEEHFRALLAIPLTIENRPIGAFNIQTRTERQFSADECELFSLIGDLAAGALLKAQLYEAQKAQLDELKTLAQISEAAISPHYLDDLLDLVTDMAAQMMNAAVCALFLINDAKTHIELRSAKRLLTPYAHRAPLQLGVGVLGYVAQSGERAYVADVTSDPRFINPARARLEGLVSMLAVPLSVRDHISGVLVCYTAERRTFSDNQITLFSALANQTALAIENARLVTNAALNREMHHRIKNNLQMVMMLMTLQLPDAERLKTRDVLETNIHRIRSIATVHEVLSEKGYRLVDVRDVLQRIARATVSAVFSHHQQIEIEIQGEGLTLPSQKATAVALVVNELVQNALEHGFKGREAGRVVVEIGRTTTHHRIMVRDDGHGLPADLQEGLGLEIAQTLVTEDLQGELSLERVTTGSQCTILFPYY